MQEAKSVGDGLFHIQDFEEPGACILTVMLLVKQKASVKWFIIMLASNLHEWM